MNNIGAPSSWSDADKAIKMSSKTFRNEHRRMMSRRRGDAIRLLGSLPPGEHKSGCCVCCTAPSCCPMLSLCICCDDAKYVMQKRETSKYVFIRENSIEWNEPEIVWSKGPCFGVDLCKYDVQDRTQVMYYDDVMFEKITDKTRVCNESRTCLCGGRGERIELTSPCCYKCCYRAYFPCPCVPVCFPTSLFPCALRTEIFVQDASAGIHEIDRALREANEHDDLYHAEPITGRGGENDNLKGTRS